MSAVETFQATGEKIAAHTEHLVLATYAEYTAGHIDLATTTAQISGTINRANATATTLADAYVVAAIEGAASRPATSVGLLPVDESERLVKAANTILTEPDDPAPRLSRMAHAEVFSTAQKAAVDAMKEQPLVAGWVRQFESEKPCALCVFIWREGRVWPKSHPFQVMHPGDRCVPRVVLTTNIQRVRKSRAR